MIEEFTVFWITGLSGSGKTTIANQLANQLRNQGSAAILLDGDLLREVFGNKFGHDRKSRIEAGYHYGRLCKMLVEQKIHVICSTISLFHEVQAWNHENIPNYREIFINVPLSILQERNSKGIYTTTSSESTKNVVGIDIAPEYPTHPHLTISNYGDMTPAMAVDIILNQQPIIGKITS